MWRFAWLEIDRLCVYPARYGRKVLRWVQPGLSNNATGRMMYPESHNALVQSDRIVCLIATKSCYPRGML